VSTGKNKGGKNGPKKFPNRATQGATGQPTGAQKRLAAQRAMAAASGARSARRRRQFWTVWAPIIAVVVLVAAFGIVKLATSNKANKATVASTGVVAAVTSVPASVLDQVGTGTSSSPPTALTGAALTAGGLPRILYVGAEWCPFCAAERWPLAVALSRFGTLTGLGQTASTPDDVDPNTPTLSFEGSKYTSTAISFTGKEIQNGSKQTLDTLDAADNAIFTTVGKGSFPFIDIAGKWLINGAQYDPGLLAGKTHAQIASALSDPTSAIAKAIDGSANVITAAICKASGDKPASVCTATAVTSAAEKLT
jgi:hypothetical protein